jgi:hypothetical protein
MAQMSYKFGEIIKNYKPLKKISQTKPHPSVPPPPAKSDGEYFPRVFHAVIPDPPNSPAVLTRRFDPPFRMAKIRGEGGVICGLI